MREQGMRHCFRPSKRLVAPRRPGWATVSFTVAALATVLAACGDEGRSSDVGPNVVALTATYPYGPGQEFGSKEGLLQPASGANDIVHYFDPALCSNEIATFLAVSVDSQGLYRTLFYDQEVEPSSWGHYGTKQFASRPACAMREQGASGGRGFVLVGKGKDNILYASPGSWDPNMHDGTPNNPTADSAFAAVGTTVLKNWGSPGLATNGAVTQMALAYIDDSGLVNVRLHALPYVGHSWANAIAAPAIGGGWTANGTPAIVWLPQTINMFQVVVRVDQRGTFSMMMTYFDAARSRFSGPTAGSQPSWTQLSVGSDSDPALAYSPTLSTTTIYLRTGSQLEQTSGFGQALGTNLVHTILSGLNATYPSGASPSALSLPFENSNNLVITRTTANQLWMTFSIQDQFLTP
jgi:hypothetical protein